MIGSDLDQTTLACVYAIAAGSAALLFWRRLADAKEHGDVVLLQYEAALARARSQHRAASESDSIEEVREPDAIPLHPSSDFTELETVE